MTGSRPVHEGHCVRNVDAAIHEIQKKRGECCKPGGKGGWQTARGVKRGGVIPEKVGGLHWYSRKGLGRKQPSKLALLFRGGCLIWGMGKSKRRTNLTDKDSSLENRPLGLSAHAGKSGIQ